MKRVLIIFSVAVLLICMVLPGTACKEEAAATEETIAEETTNVEEAPASEEETKNEDVTNLPTFALVSSDTIGDRGFVDMADTGIKKAADELNIEYKFFSCNNDSSIYLDTLKAAAENYDVIFIIPGYFFDKELEETMKIYPDKEYIYIDGVTALEGGKSVLFSQNEGAFLAGILASNLTKDSSIEMINDKKIVGFVGGADMPVIRDYQAGYEQGVKYADPTVEVIVNYAGDHFNPELGKVTSFNTYEKGADVIFKLQDQQDLVY